jgi:DNA-binding beta-propeller fold protein YncE
MKAFKNNRFFKTSLLTSTILFASCIVYAQHDTSGQNSDDAQTPPGLFVTPTAPLTDATQQPLNPGLTSYPDYVAGEAVKAVVSPDGKDLAVLTAGFNSLYKAFVAGLPATVDTAASTQFIFLYDVSGKNKSRPVLTQVIQQLNSHVGLVWSPNSRTLYATGGCDDAVYAYSRTGNAKSNYVPSAKISLGHAPNGCLANSANQKGLGLGVEPNAAGLGISADGRTLVVANNYNDSISVIDTASATVRYEYDLRPYATSASPGGTKGGTFPYSVMLNGNTAYVGCDRDREVVVVNLGATAGSLVTRIPLDGNPNGMALSNNGQALYVAQDNQDQVAVINTATNTITHKLDTRGPSYLGLPAGTTGAAPTAVTINGNMLYAVNAGSNSVAVIPLTGPAAFTTTGLIPTAYDPTDIAFSDNGKYMYIVNGKSDTGPNPGYGYGNLAAIKFVTFPGGNAAESDKLTANNEYQFQLEHATLVSAKVPDDGDLPGLTSRVAQNNAYSVVPPSSDAQVMQFLHSKIQHVIYIVKENRTFDQILGDLGNGSNGDPALTLFGKLVTPSFHLMAQNFVTLDNFMDPGDGSMDGWSWSMRGRVTNTETITQQENYARVNRGLSYEGEGQNRNIPSNLNTVAGRDFFFDPTGATTPYSSNTASMKGGTANILAGDGDHAATDGPAGYQQGYIFNAVLNAGGKIRNYGWMANTPGSIGTIANPIKDPFAAGVVQTTAANQLIYQNGFYDPYFRAYDQAYPDVWRFNEWNREFQQFVANGNLPALEMIRGLSHDHTGSFAQALGGVNTPELQQADNDYAVGLLVQAVANSPYASNTLIFIIEDDSQDGADHVDSHRATTYVVGPYVKKNTVVNTRYSQPSVLRTIEDILGTQHINLNTHYTRPMADVFDITSSGAWTFTAVASTLLKQTTLALAQHDGNVQYAQGPDLKPTHNAKYWAAKTRGFDFSSEDRVPADLYNKILWEGLKGTKAPVPHSRFQKVADARKTKGGDPDDDDR